MKYSNDERVKQARSNVYTAYSYYNTIPTDESKRNLIKRREH